MALEPYRGVPVVLDPVMVAKGGAALLDPAAVEALKTQLLPLATLITPNLPEAAALLGEPEASDRTAMEALALKLCALGTPAALPPGRPSGGAEAPTF